MEERRRLRATVVPTDVGEVKALLRQLGQPITLFGEREVCGRMNAFSFDCFGDLRNTQLRGSERYLRVLPPVGCSLM